MRGEDRWDECDQARGRRLRGDVACGVEDPRREAEARTGGEPKARWAGD
jgi:hypothetical protein